MLRALAFAAAMGFPSPPMALAHHTPSGIPYPFDCCSHMDCHVVPPENVREVEGGAIVKTFRGDLFFPKAKERKPLDGDWHECHRAKVYAAEPPLVPLCIFPPFKGF